MVVAKKLAWSGFLSSRDVAVAEKIGFSSASIGNRPALIVIDVMRAFFGDAQQTSDIASSDWPFSCGQSAWDALPHTRSLVGAFREQGLPVFYARMEGPQFAPVNGRDPGEIMPEIAPEPDDMVFTKTAPSAFFGTPLMSYLTSLGVDSVVLCGTSTSGCVRATAVDAFSCNLQVSIAQDATFDRFEASHAVSLFDMAIKYAKVAPVAEFISIVAALPQDVFAGRAYDRNFEATTAQASVSL